MCFKDDFISIQEKSPDYFNDCLVFHWRRQWQPTPVLLPGKSHGQRSLVGCSPWGRQESDTTERLHFHFSLSCVGEGNGNPLQCSCLENLRDEGDWWVVVYGVAQSRTRLKRLSSSSKEELSYCFCEKQQNKKPEKDIFHFPTTGGDVAKQIEDVPC